jgi:3-phosphoshikimate 1-carboxyvinyltransferase
LHQRPFGQLFKALRHFNVTIDSNADTLPATVHPQSVTGASIKLRDLPSSQIITALMLAGLWMKNDLEMILPESTPSLPYIMMTFKLMKRLGLSTEYNGNRIHVAGSQPNLDWNLRVEKDFSAASYWVVFGLLHGTKIVFPNITLPSLQGDERIFHIADQVGAHIMLFSDRLELLGTVKKGIDIDANDIPDLVPALSILAMFAPEKSRITNIKHLEYKESNRISAIRTNVELLGGKTNYHDGNLEIIPNTNYTSAALQSFNDHRIAMSFAIAGTRIPGTCIKGPECVKKSYPNFWQDLSWWEEIADA